MVLTAYSRLSPAIGLFVTVTGHDAKSIAAYLTPASRRQDHMASPSASVLFVKSTTASTASRTHVRDDRDTPLLVARDGPESAGDLGARSTEQSCDHLARRANHLNAQAVCQGDLVIPGRCEASSPESISSPCCWEKWIPSLRLSAQTSFAILSRRRIPE
jgi:hypothetical protein